MNINYFMHTGFIKYIKNNNITAVKSMLDDGVKKKFDIDFEIEKNGHEALREAAAKGNIAVIDLLLNYGRPTQERYETVLRTSVVFNQIHLVRHIIEEMEQVIDIKKECIFAFKLSGEYGHVECMEYFLSKGMDRKILENSSNIATRKWSLKHHLEKELDDCQLTSKKMKL